MLLFEIVNVILFTSKEKNIDLYWISNHDCPFYFLKFCLKIDCEHFTYRKQACSANELFNFTWTLYVRAKGKYGLCTHQNYKTMLLQPELDKWCLYRRGVRREKFTS